VSEALLARLEEHARGGPHMTKVRRAAGTPPTLLAFVWRVSAPHQLGLVLVSVLVFAVGVVPLQIQRRGVNEAFVGGSLDAILGLALAYAAVAISAGLFKLALNMYRSYVSEHGALASHYAHR